GRIGARAVVGPAAVCREAWPGCRRAWRYGLGGPLYRTPCSEWLIWELSMAKKPLEWYDPTAKPTEEWDPVIEARRQQLRLSQQHSVLNAYLLMPNAANRPKA